LIAEGSSGGVGIKVPELSKEPLYYEIAKNHIKKIMYLIKNII
jgi:hypothetical protein